MAAALPEQSGLLSGSPPNLRCAGAAQPGSSSVYGADVSGAMLRYGQQKIAGAAVNTLVQADAAVLCFPNDTFDAVTVAFGVRNYSELERGLREMQRVLRPGGRTIILEFSMPETPVFRASYLFYFRHILPRIAGIISRQYDAYH